MPWLHTGDPLDTRSPRGPGDATPSSEDSPPPTEADPREYEPEFLALPELTQDRLRREWRQERIEQSTQTARSRDHRVQSWIEGAIVFLLAEFIFIGLSLGTGLFLVLIGALTGWVAHVVNAQRGLAALVAFGGLFLARTVVGWPPALYTMLYCVVGVVLFVGVRIPRESERWGW